MAFDVVFIRRLLPTSKDNRISHQIAMHDASLCLLITPTFLTLHSLCYMKIALVSLHRHMKIWYLIWSLEEFSLLLIIGQKLK